MLISLRNVEKSYPVGVGRTYVLRRINLDIKDGEFVSIMGPSGAGKSTVLHILGMHDSAWSGEYYFTDQPVHRLNPKQRSELHKKHIGFVFQSYHLLDNLTVYENLEIPSRTEMSAARTARAWSPTFSTGSRSWGRRTCIRTSCRAANNSWSASRAP